MGLSTVLAALGAASGLWKENSTVAGLFALAAAISSGTLVALDSRGRAKRSFRMGVDYEHVANYAENLLATRIDYITLREAQDELERVAKQFDDVRDAAVSTHE